jgi:hypothetical protein
MRLRSQKEIVHEIYNGTPPPLLSREGDEAAIKLGQGLTFARATRIELGGPDKNTAVDPLSPPTQGPTAPDNAYLTTVEKAPAPPAASANGKSPETVFTAATTRVPLPPPPKMPRLMSAQGSRVAKNSAPQSAFKTGGK